MIHLFNRTHADIRCNTAYPYRPAFFAKYSSLADIMQGVEALSLYFHIPFCTSLCKFCEYTRFLSSDVDGQRRYMRMLESQVATWLQSHAITRLYGLDIGGGTPTALEAPLLRRLLALTTGITNRFQLVDDFESSIEFSYGTLDEEKIEFIAASGIRRGSTGIQAYDRKLMQDNRRDFSSIDRMAAINERLRAAGIEKINIDLMYGLPRQTDAIIKDSIEAAIKLAPDQITLYETRYATLGTPDTSVNRDRLFAQYCLMYEHLNKARYTGRFGQNAFSRRDDEGVSSYLRYRMNRAIPYKGFGIAAQSMSSKGISYNSCKGAKEPHMPELDAIVEEDIYALPPDEIVAKYISIALYSGRFNVRTVASILGADMWTIYGRQLDFLLDKGFATIDGDYCTLTRDGFYHYGAIASLFWSQHHKQAYRAAVAQQEC